jgi:type IV pilus assembly protein PilX
MIMMYGIPAAMNSTQNERMAGNTRQRDLAFQAAESALKDADDVLNDISSPIDPIKAYINASNTGATLPPLPAGLVLNGESHANDAAYWRDDGTANTFDWDTANNYRTPTSTLSEVAQQPRYVVEKMPDASYPGPPAVTKHYYRVTAMGVGKDSSAVVILQAMYEFP